MPKISRIACLGWISFFCACSGFEQVVLDGSLLDGSLPGDGSSLLPDSSKNDGSSVSDAKPLPDADLPADGSGGKLKVGYCCGKHEDCASGHCGGWNGSVNLCIASCVYSKETPDTCPIGFKCNAEFDLCYPPSVGGYECGAHVANATAQPQGGCCAKGSDCQSNHCDGWGDMPGICSDVCDPNNDTCPTGFACRKVEKTCAPVDVFNYTCSWP
jgi:hypothetical protein